MIKSFLGRVRRWWISLFSKVKHSQLNLHLPLFLWWKKNGYHGYHTFESSYGFARKYNWIQNSIWQSNSDMNLADKIQLEDIGKGPMAAKPSKCKAYPMPVFRRNFNKVKGSESQNIKSMIFLIQPDRRNIPTFPKENRELYFFPWASASLC